MRLAISLLFLALPLGAAEKTRTLTNEPYGFEVTVPSAWSVQKVQQDDLDTALDTGTAVMSLGGAGDEVKDPNGFQINAVQMSIKPLPTVIVYAHRKPNQDAEALAKIIEEHLAKWETKPLVRNTSYTVNGMTGLEIEYDVFVPTRIVALFHDGTRYTFHYFVPAGETKWFKKYRKDFDEVVRSFRLVTSTPAR